MTLKLQKTVKLSEKSKAFIKKRTDVWYAGKETGKLIRFDDNLPADQDIEEVVFPDFSIADGGMTQREEKIYTATAKDRRLYVTDTKKKVRREVLDFKTIPGGVNAVAVRADNSEIADIAWHDDTLWVAVAAGYSSCIMQVDVKKKKILKDFWSPGPKPYGLDFDSQNRLWVLDGRMNTLVRGDQNGAWNVEAERLPISDVRYLSIDANDDFWTTDSHKSRIFCVRKEG